MRSFSSAPDSKPGRLEGHIELKSLSFSFTPVSPPFINDLSLRIPAGSQLAIVGGSGSGKTTLIRLLAGLYQPSAGQILFDGISWENHGDRLMRDSLAYVPQQVFIFNASVHDNITLWRPGYSLDQLEAAAIDAQILETINRHPESFARNLHDNGSDLSGGERQRLEPAGLYCVSHQSCSLMKRQVRLDNATQTRVLDALKSRGLTVVSVAHRLDAALRSDQVLVMKDGAVVEQGAPQELMDCDGAFRALVLKEQQGALTV